MQHLKMDVPRVTDIIGNFVETSTAKRYKSVVQILNTCLYEETKSKPTNIKLDFIHSKELLLLENNIPE